ncbi:MAG: DUF5668 domain-containing protein [Nanoarchaeota archaeon]
MMCKKCMGMSGGIMLVAGILFLLRDLGTWNFWNIQWWTVLFILMGICHLCAKSCSDCCKMDGKKR